MTSGTSPAAKFVDVKVVTGVALAGLRSYDFEQAEISPSQPGYADSSGSLTSAPTKPYRGLFRV